MAMRRNLLLVLTLLLASCSKSEAVMGEQALGSSQIKDEIPLVKPDPSTRIAYVYSVTYEFEKNAVGQVQGQQLDLCRSLGPQRCVMIKSTLSAPQEGDHIVSNEAVLLIDASMANTINKQLDAIATKEGAVVANRQVEAEDVTLQVIEADARVKAKQALAQRLLSIIRSGNGKVNELVEAEKAYATTQEELDSAREEQAALARRVAMSRLSITYVFDNTPGRGSPIAASLASASETLGASVAALVTALVAGLPWILAGGLVIAAMRWLRRKMGWRWPRRA